MFVININNLNIELIYTQHIRDLNVLCLWISKGIRMVKRLSEIDLWWNNKKNPLHYSRNGCFSPEQTCSSYAAAVAACMIWIHWCWCWCARVLVYAKLCIGLESHLILCRASSNKHLDMMWVLLISFRMERWILWVSCYHIVVCAPNHSKSNFKHIFTIFHI